MLLPTGVMRIRLAVVLALCLIGCALAVGPARAADVHGDDERDVYVGTGGLLLPGGVETDRRQQVASCSDCTWRLAAPCIRPAHGHAFDGQSPCLSVVRGCAAGQRLLRSWFRGPAGPWREVGLVCMGAGGPVTVAEVADAVHARAEHAVPSLEPARWPRAGLVVQLPVVFASGQPPGPQTWSPSILGRQVEVTAHPEWTWEFGDGAVFRTGKPGGPFPDASVAHVYRNAGPVTVVVSTRWTATFTVDGLGPFGVPEPISQRSAFRVSVGEGRALIVPS